MSNQAVLAPEMKIDGWGRNENKCGSKRQGLPVWPWDIVELLPPSMNHQWHIESQDEWHGYKTCVTVTVSSNTLKYSEIKNHSWPQDIRLKNDQFSSDKHLTKFMIFIRLLIVLPKGQTHARTLPPTRPPTHYFEVWMWLWAILFMQVAYARGKAQILEHIQHTIIMTLWRQLLGYFWGVL